MDFLRIFCLLFGVFLLVNGQALQAQDHEHNHDHNHYHSEHPKNEIGLGNYLSYLAGEEEFAYSMHIHYLRFFNESTFGAGMGYEQIFDEHGHRSLTVIGTYSFSAPLILSLAPGILFGNNENPNAAFVLHAEAVYEFEIGLFHIGPALEFATTFEEHHIGVGVHFAFAF